MQADKWSAAASATSGVRSNGTFDGRDCGLNVETAAMRSSTILLQENHGGFIQGREALARLSGIKARFDAAVRTSLCTLSQNTSVYKEARFVIPPNFLKPSAPQPISVERKSEGLRAFAQSRSNVGLATWLNCML